MKKSFVMEQKNKSISGPSNTDHTNTDHRISKNRDAVRLRKGLLKSLRRLEKAFNRQGSPAIAKFREKLNAL